MQSAAATAGATGVHLELFKSDRRIDLMPKCFVENRGRKRKRKQLSRRRFKRATAIPQ
jgi:hypothetical protein